MIPRLVAHVLRYGIRFDSPLNRRLWGLHCSINGHYRPSVPALRKYKAFQILCWLTLFSTVSVVATLCVQNVATPTRLVAATLVVAMWCTCQWAVDSHWDRP